MEQNLDAGQTDSSVAIEGATTPTGNDRLPPDGETPVRAGMEGPWVVWVIPHGRSSWVPVFFPRLQEAYWYWIDNGGYLCKSLIHV